MNVIFIFWFFFFLVETEAEERTGRAREVVVDGPLSYIIKDGI